MANVHLVVVMISAEIDLTAMAAEYGESFDVQKAREYLTHDVRESISGFPYRHAITKLEVK